MNEERHPGLPHPLLPLRHPLPMLMHTQMSRKSREHFDVVVRMPKIIRLMHVICTYSI